MTTFTNLWNKDGKVTFWWGSLMPDRLLLHPIVSFRHLVGHFKLKYHLRKMRKGLKKMTGEEYSDAGLILGIEKWLGGVDSETKGE